jgi:hypothetical protein
MRVDEEMMLASMFRIDPGMPYGSYYSFVAVCVIRGMGGRWVVKGQVDSELPLYAFGPQEH